MVAIAIYASLNAAAEKSRSALIEAQQLHTENSGAAHDAKKALDALIQKIGKAMLKETTDGK